MIDPSADANSRLPESSSAALEAPPQLPPPLPVSPPLQPANAPAAAARPPSVSRPAPRSRGAWKYIVLGLVAAAGLTVFVSQTLFSRAQEFASKTTRAEPGLRQFNDRISGPLSIHVVEIDRARNDLGFYASLASGKVLGVARISEMARALPREIGRAVAVVNGDFYERDNRTYAGDPRGLQIVDGELVSGPSTAAVWFDPAGSPHVDDVRDDFLITWPNGQKLDFGINEQRRANSAVLYSPTYGESTRVAAGRDLVLEKSGDGPWLPLQPNQKLKAKVREVLTTGNSKLAPDTLVLSLGPQLLSKVPAVEPGAVLEISTRLIPDLTGVKTAIAGGPALIKNGKPFADRSPPDGSAGAYSERSKYEQHPRSAIGWNDKKIFLITVDGRQPGLSVGINLADLAEYMVKKLGCTDGMNFDGGNSASIWMSGTILNNPCQGERAVANGLLVYRKEAAK
jgi:hypothetical protein